VAPSGKANISVISAKAALTGKAALMGVLPTGLFPRELSYDTADHSVLMSNFLSASVQMFSVPPAAGS
jgi:hypothetical protein